jgi:hypothetical protein
MKASEHLHTDTYTKEWQKIGNRGCEQNIDGKDSVLAAHYIELLPTLRNRFSGT